MKLVARLESVSRGFGGDNATYSCEGKTIVVAVGWACLTPYHTVVTIDGNVIAEFHHDRYVQPAEALSILGYEVSGTVDFAQSMPACITVTEENMKIVELVEVTKQKLLRVADKVIAVVMKKNRDYGDAWQRQGGAGWAVRLSDKLMRIENLASGQEALVLDERIEDTLYDAIGYSLLGLLWLNEKEEVE